MRQVFYLKGNAVTRCRACGLYYMLTVASGGGGELALDRTKTEAALRSLRICNYEHVLRRLQERTALTGRKLLDVGCGSGLFLDLARRTGCECYGIEPDGFFYSRAAIYPPAVAQLVQGFFARDLPPEWAPFDIITFHDVFEHLDDPGRMLRAARDQLASGGYLVFSLPVADGFVFRLARSLFRLGIAEPLERMFQVHYPYPHLFYFTVRSFVSLAQHAGMEPVLVERLRSFSIRGALHRVEMDRSSGASGDFKRYAAAAMLSVFALTEPVVPADSVLVVLQPPATRS
jgi:SAM-dependent methyltransferase